MFEDINNEKLAYYFAFIILGVLVCLSVIMLLIFPTLLNLSIAFLSSIFGVFITLLLINFIPLRLKEKTKQDIFLAISPQFKRILKDIYTDTIKLIRNKKGTFIEDNFPKVVEVLEVEEGYFEHYSDFNEYDNLYLKYRGALLEISLINKSSLPDGFNIQISFILERLHSLDLQLGFKNKILAIKNVCAIMKHLEIMDKKYISFIDSD